MYTNKTTPSYTILRLLQLTALFCVSLFIQACSLTQPGQANGVRHLNVATAGLSSELRFGVEDILLLDNAKTIQTRLGSAAAAQVLSQINLEHEQLAVVPWNTGGPPFGTLRHRDSTEHPQWIEFYIQSPNPTAARGLSIRLGLGFFAIPKNRQALLLKGEKL